jgi:hypothetical protein
MPDWKDEMQRITAREFFRRLHFVNASEVGHSQLSFSPTLSGYPIFSFHELTNEPLKWLKYVLLGRLGLRPLNKLATEIKRFPIESIREAQEQCVELMTNAVNRNQNILLVIKLVPMDFAGQLPNFRITNLDEITSAFRSVVATQRLFDREIWICESITEIGKLNLAGRYILPSTRSLSMILEVLWYTSPRLLETVNLSVFPYPYLRARCKAGNSQFQIEELHIPSELVSKQVTSEEGVLEDFHWLLRNIYTFREKINELEAVVTAAGAQELSLEFKSDNGNFRFIDWDTEVETGGWII